MTTAPIAGNQYYTGLSTQAAQLPELSLGELTVDNVNVAGVLTLENGYHGNIQTPVVKLAAVDLLGDYQVLAAQSGTTFVLPEVSVLSTIRLPQPTGLDGVSYRFLSGGATVTALLTITSGDSLTPNVVGTLLDSGAAITAPLNNNGLCNLDTALVPVTSLTVLAALFAPNLDVTFTSTGDHWHLKGHVAQTKLAGGPPTAADHIARLL